MDREIFPTEVLMVWIAGGDSVIVSEGDNRASRNLLCRRPGRLQEFACRYEHECYLCVVVMVTVMKQNLQSSMPLGSFG